MEETSSLSKESFLERVKGPILRLQQNGVVLTREIINAVLRSYPQNRRGFQQKKDPLTRLVVTFGKGAWIEYIASNAWIRRDVMQTLSCVLHQYRFKAIRNDSIALSEVSLVARRHLLLLVLQQKVPVDAGAQQSESRLELPRGSADPSNIRLRGFAEDEINFFNQKRDNLLLKRNLYCGVPSHRRSEKSVGVNDDLDEAVGDDRDDIEVLADLGIVGSHAELIRRETSVTRAMAAYAPLKPVAIKILVDCYGVRRQSVQSDDDLRCYLLALIEVMHGIPYDDARTLGVVEPSELGQITPSVLRLNLGSGFYPNAREAYAPGVLELPLADEIVTILEELGFDGSERTLGSFLGPNAHGMYRRWLRRYVSAQFPSFNMLSVALYKVFEDTATHDLDISIPLVGMLSATPLNITRGESAYIQVKHSELVSSLELIQDRVRVKAGVVSPPRRRPTLMSNSDEIFGSPGVTYSEFWNRSRTLIDSATSHNKALACVERFMRGLGTRVTRDHINPLVHYVSHPVPALELMDKVVQGGDRPRYLPISAAIATLLQTCAELFGKSYFLPYDASGRPVPFRRLPKSLSAQMNARIGDRGMRQAGRTGFYNTYRQAGIGQVLANAGMAHGAAEMQVFAPYGIYPAKAIILHQQHHLFKVFREFGVDACATRLSNVLRQYIDRELCLRKMEDGPEQL